MPRQSISFTKPNDEWLKAQVVSEEYSSKSELVNDLIRQARKAQARVDWIRAKLDKSESSGFTIESKEQILNQSKALDEASYKNYIKMEREKAHFDSSVVERRKKEKDFGKMIKKYKKDSRKKKYQVQ